MVNFYHPYKYLSSTKNYLINLKEREKNKFRYSEENVVALIKTKLLLKK